MGYVVKINPARRLDTSRTPSVWLECLWPCHPLWYRAPGEFSGAPWRRHDFRVPPAIAVAHHVGGTATMLLNSRRYMTHHLAIGCGRVLFGVWSLCSHLLQMWRARASVWESTKVVFAGKRAQVLPCTIQMLRTATMIRDFVLACMVARTSWKQFSFIKKKVYLYDQSVRNMLSLKYIFKKRCPSIHKWWHQ